MANGKQHIPVFVGSTFTDLKEYRDATQNALHRLELIVRGMEFFCSNPTSPLEVCLRAVRNCEIYIGIFGMRYGSIPKGHAQSMTHLEYEEAQKSPAIPSLIFIIDEDHPIPSKHVETGSGAVKLDELKALLREKHLVSTFTTPDDLAVKVIQSVSEQLRRIGTKIDEGSIEAKTSVAILRDYFVMPKRYVGKEVVVDFVAGPDFGAANEACCEAWSLVLGETVSASVKLLDGNTWLLVGEGDIGERLRRIPQGEVATLRGIISYGEVADTELLKLGKEKKQPISGLLIKEILRHTPQKSISRPKRPNWRWEK